MTESKAHRGPLVWTSSESQDLSVVQGFFRLNGFIRGKSSFYLAVNHLTVVGLCEDAFAAIFEQKHRLLDSGVGLGMRRGAFQCHRH